MSNKPLARSVGELGSRYIDAYVRTAEQYTSLWSGQAKNEKADRTEGMPKRYADFVLEEAPRMWKQMAEAGLTYYTDVLNTGVEVAKGFYEQVLQVETPRSRPAKTATGSALVFRGRRGERCSNAFVVSNANDEPIEVGFALSELTSEDGRTTMRTRARFTPETCQVPPRSEQVVQCSLDLSEGLLPGVVYRGEIQVAGFPEMSIKIAVRADEASTHSGPNKS